MSTLVTATVKSNSSSPPAFQNSSGTQIGTLCRAWVNFNGTSTVAIRTQFNVSSITDDGTGQFRINFSTSMSDANYVSVVEMSGNTDTNNTFSTNITTNSYSPTASSGVACTKFNGSTYDSSIVCYAVFR